MNIINYVLIGNYNLHRICLIDINEKDPYQHWLRDTDYVEKCNDSVKCLNKLSRAGNSGGTREPSSQKQFGFSETFCGFERLKKLDSKMFLKFLHELCFFAESISVFVKYPKKITHF